jgi:hypothetical protein
MNTTFENQLVLNSLDDLLNVIDMQLTAQDIVNGRAYFKNVGWTNFEFHDKDKVFKMIADCLAGHLVTREEIKRNLYKKPQHWGLKRILFDFRNNKIICNYCAGQDYQSERQIIRNYLKNY